MGKGVPKVTIRRATLGDAARLVEIYAYYVQETAVSFEYDVPSEGEFRSRMRRTLERYPYLVAERDGAVVGFGYAGPFVGRPAYDWSAEMTIYLDHGCRGGGVGTVLYDSLEDCLRSMGVLNANACIGVPREEGDPYLTNASPAFHARRGYRMVGTFSNSGYKFGRWYDMCWMEKDLGPHPALPAPIRPFPLVENPPL